MRVDCEKMVFTFTVIRRTIFGDKRVVYGTFTNDTTGGEINTGLHYVEFFSVEHTGSEAVTESPSVNETFRAERTIEIVTTNAKSGLWLAVGM